MYFYTKSISMKKYEVEKLLKKGLDINKLSKDLQSDIFDIRKASEEFKENGDEHLREMDQITAKTIIELHKDAFPTKKPSTKKPTAKKPTEKPKVEKEKFSGILLSLAEKSIWHQGENKKWYPGTIKEITTDKEYFHIIYTLDSLEITKETLTSPQIPITKLDDFSQGKKVESFTTSKPSESKFEESVATIEDCRELLRAERSSKAVEAAETREEPTKFDLFEKAMTDRAKKYLDLVKHDEDLAKKVKRLLRNQESDMKKLIFGSEASLREVNKIIDEEFDKKIN